MKTTFQLCLGSSSMALALLLWSAAGCESSGGGIERPRGNSDGAGGNGGTSTDGAGGTGNSTNGAAGADAAGAAGMPPSNSSGGSQSTQGSTGGDSVVTTSGGTGGTATSSTTTGGGSGGTTIQVAECTFHTEPAEAEGSGGQGGAGSEDVHLASSNFVGQYLVDSAGITLYIYGADFPGDCETSPISNCVDDCALAWPIFDAGARSLGEGLPDEAFGTFMRPDGLPQTTYLGWPLYYFRRDVAPGDLVGQGLGRIWFIAETELPNIMVMRASEENGGIRYLSTDRGYTLYAYANDTLGTVDGMPESACTGTCLDDYVPFTLNAFRPASPIDPSDVTVFIRGDSGQLQVAYKGMPLYTSVLDARSGELNGVQPETFSVVEL